MPKSVLPFLMFQGNAEAALEFYRTALEGVQLDRIERYGENEPVAAGALKTARMTMLGQEVMIYDSPPMHDFGFTPSFSFFVECADEDEVRRLAAAFAEGGHALMPVGNYGFSRLYAWVADRFGVTWQFNLA
jgi:predicted 3-demethylubiquinone-9 3-methyltransferase (glyoxalase superfamily)